MSVAKQFFMHPKSIGDIPFDEFREALKRYPRGLVLKGSIGDLNRRREDTAAGANPFPLDMQRSLGPDCLNEYLVHGESEIILLYIPENYQSHLVFFVQDAVCPLSKPEDMESSLLDFKRRAENFLFQQLCGADKGMVIQAGESFWLGVVSWFW